MKHKTLFSKTGNTKSTADRLHDILPGMSTVFISGDTSHYSRILSGPYLLLGLLDSIKEAAMTGRVFS